MVRRQRAWAAARALRIVGMGGLTAKWLADEWVWCVAAAKLTGFVEIIVLFNLRRNGAHGFVAIDVYKSQ